MLYGTLVWTQSDIHLIWAISQKKPWILRGCSNHRLQLWLHVSLKQVTCVWRHCLNCDDSDKVSWINILLSREWVLSLPHPWQHIPLSPAEASHLMAECRHHQRFTDKATDNNPWQGFSQHYTALLSGVCSTILMHLPGQIRYPFTEIHFEWSSLNSCTGTWCWWGTKALFVWVTGPLHRKSQEECDP